MNFLTALSDKQQRPDNNVEVKVITVSPTEAKVILEKRNKTNRRLRETVWYGYAVDMLNGKWDLNGEPIIFDSNGDLVDGQHRLHACKESKIPLRTVAVFGVQPESFETIDGGLKRQTSDTLRHLPNANMVAAAGRLAWMYDHVGVERINNPKLAGTRQQHKQYIRDNEKELCAAATAVAGNQFKRYVAASWLALCYFLFARQDKRVAHHFFDELSHGTGLTRTDPVYLLRERLIANKAAKARLKNREVFALICKAWIAYRDGKKIKTLRWRSSGTRMEALPQI